MGSNPTLVTMDIQLGEKVRVVRPTDSYVGFVTDIRTIKQQDMQLPPLHEYKVVDKDGKLQWHSEVDIAKTK